jgi:hypothetical protein
LQPNDILPRLIREVRNGHVVVYVDILHLEKGFMSAGASYALPIACAGKRAVAEHLSISTSFRNSSAISLSALKSRQQHCRSSHSRQRELLTSSRLGQTRLVPPRTFFRTCMSAVQRDLSRTIHISHRPIQHLSRYLYGDHRRGSSGVGKANFLMRWSP